jgi:hypothetical protein
MDNPSTEKLIRKMDDDSIRGLELGIEAIKKPAKKENRPLAEDELYQINKLEERLIKLKRQKNHSERIKELAQNEFIEESIILTVTTFEFLMRDLIKDSKSQWFFLSEFQVSRSTPEVKTAIRKKIKQYLEKLNLFDEYIKNVYLYQDIENSEIEALYHTLFDDEKNFEKFNFQNLNRDNGVKSVFKFLFEIDIRNYLDTDEKNSRKKWKLLEQLIKERHKIIHHGEFATLKPIQVIEVLNAIDLLYHIINKKIIGHSITQMMTQFNLYTKELESRKNANDN